MIAAQTMTTEEKLIYVRQHWTELKEKGLLRTAIQKILDTDEWLGKNYSVDDIIGIEESMPNYLK